jgi:ABC-2 type transport system permease protein
MTSAIRAELLKLRTARLPWSLLALTVGLTSLERLLFDSNAGGTGHMSIPSLATYAGQSQAINITGELLLLSTVVGIVIASGEFRHRTATSTYLATPNRTQVLAAKAVAAATIGLLFGLAGAAAATGIGLAFVAGGGHHLLRSTATVARDAAGATLGAALLGVAGVAIGSLIRSQVGAIIAIFVWAFVIEQSVGGIYNSAQRYLPYTAAGAMAGTKLGSEKTPLPFAAAIALLAAAALLIMVIATQTTLDADIT